MKVRLFPVAALLLIAVSAAPMCTSSNANIAHARRWCSITSGSFSAGFGSIKTGSGSTPR